MSDSEYSDDSLSSLNLNDDLNNFNSDFDNSDSDDSLSSLGISNIYNGGKKSKINKKNNQNKKSFNLSRNKNISDDDIINSDIIDETDKESILNDDDANEQLLNDDNIINNDSDSDSDKELKSELDSDIDSDDELLSDIDKDKDKDKDKNNKIEILPVNNNYPIIVDKKNRISRPYLTKYEYVRCLGERTQQITAGAKVMIKNANELLKFKSPEDIAKLEIKEKCCPYIIVRPLPNNKEEHWDINELDILFPI